MSNASTVIIDSDRHVIEAIDMWARYLPAKYHEWIPYMESNPDATVDEPLLPHYLIKGQPLFNKWNENLKLQRAIVKKTRKVGYSMAQAAAPDSQIASMTESGIDKAYLFPTYAPFIVANENVPAEVSVAFAKAYNAWLKDYCEYDPSRFYGVGLISRHDPQAMLEQLDIVIGYGWTTVVLRPECLCGRDLGHPDHEPFWQACEENNIAVAFHGGTHLNAPTAGAQRFDSHFAMHACAHPHEMQMAFLSLLESGVFERHPNLKFAFLEGGAAWLPHWLWRLDEVCLQPLAEEVAEHIKLSPSEYFKRQCWIGFEPEEPCLREVIEWVGLERMIFGTDFPHPDHLHFSVDQLWGEGSSLTEAEVKRILTQNALGFFEQPLVEDADKLVAGL